MTANPDWWQSFFEGPVLEVWRASVPAEMTTAEADLIVAMLELNAGERLLDAPCGCGRLALPLAGRGLHVAGVDIAPQNIELANSDAAQAGAGWRGG